MIKIQIDVLASISLSISIIILILWIVSERKNRISSEIKTDNFLWECPTCFYTYVDSCSDGISRCPQCQTLHRKQEKV